MRRSRNMGRLSGNMSGGPGGPLLTEHLKDIDLELELLKRKREMLEQQQFGNQSFIQPQRNYNQQSYSYNQIDQGGGANDFSHLYNDGPQQYRKQFAKKRQSDSDWHHDSFPKRSSGHGQRGLSHAGHQRPFSGPSSQPKSTPFKYGQGKQSIGFKPSNQKKNTNKIIKPTKAFTPPNKIASQPVAARKDLVAAAIKSVAEAESRDREALRLLPGKEPTKQMTGRMELALGSVLRNIREMCAGAPYEESLRPSNIQRVIKQAIRDRIRGAMLGKVVGSTQEILKEYRDIYPKHTDTDIVNKALEEAGYVHKPMKETEKIEKLPPPTPNSFYKQSVCRLIDSQLQEMFDKLHEIYNPPTEKVEIDFTEDNLEPSSQNKNAEAEIANVGVEKSTDAAENATVVAEKPADSAENPTDSTENPTDSTKNPKDSTEKATDSAKTPSSGEVVKATPADYKCMLPRLLKRHIPTILKLINMNKMYRSCIADIQATTRTMYVEYAQGFSKNEVQAIPADKQVETPTPVQKPPQLHIPYFVKVMGKPQLPKKKVMHTFLEVFKPKSIKKHRNIHNLLFIGFAEKEDFEGIIKADGTVIGRSTLSIRVCERSAGKPETEANNSKSENTGVIDLTAEGDAKTKEDVSKEDTLMDSNDIGAELDGQIDELLSNIRKAEEDENQAVAGDENKESEDIAEAVTEKTDEKVEQDKAEDTATVEKYNTTTVEKDNTTAVEKDNTATVENDNTATVENDNTATVENDNTASAATVTNGNAENTKQKLPETIEITEESNGATTEVDNVENDQMGELKAATTGTSTPTRSSSRLAATPSSIRTRRASRLMQN